MSTLPSLQFDSTGYIARICLNNPARHNALSNADIELAMMLLDEVVQNNAVRVLLLTAQGERTFCAGAALNEMSSGALNGQIFERLTDQLAQMPIPTVCQLNGNAYGGGAELALCCDYRIGRKDMRMFVPASRFGLCYPINGIRRYVQKLGIDTANRLLLASEEFNGEQLLNLGFLTHAELDQDVAPTAHNLCQLITSRAPIATKAMKAIALMEADNQFDPSKALELLQDCNQSQDLQEGLAANAEKRAPLFLGG